ncbi:MAG TPA: glucodextranase DOMON-like domain-containing protein [Limnochordia bacterium]|nr:glucodextranase DOMON-like domain-containing protein [Limnochordia bacterium]
MQRILVWLLVLLCTGGQAAAGQVLFQMRDPRGDDRGAGDVEYPSHEVFVPGLFDLLSLEVSADEQYVYFDLEFAALTNPFRAPEGYFHQRLEVYITTGSRPGPDTIFLGSHQLSTGSSAGWDLRLSAAPFGETRLYIRCGPEGSFAVFSQGVSSRALPGENIIRLQVDRTLLPSPSPKWGYYVLVGSFDGLAPDFWRETGLGPWQVGGTGVPVFDLLAPRLARHSQKAQLSKGVLVPVYAGKSTYGFFLGGAGIAAAACFLLWRWRRGT